MRDSGLHRRWSRRRLLKGAATASVGLASAALIGCGGDSDEGAPAAPAAASTAGASPAAGAAPKVADVPRGGQLKVGRSADPLSLDPHFGTSGGDRELLHLVYDRLVNTGPNGLLDPSRSIAEKWEYPEPTKLVLRLRSGITMYNSDEPVNAELIKWNLTRAMDAKATSRAELAAVDSIDVVSQNEVVLKLKEVSAPLLTNFTDRAGCIVSRRQVEKLGPDKFLREPLGSGPFHMQEWLSDARVTFVRNKKYWGKDGEGRPKPYLDEIRLEVIPDETVRTAALESGDIDILATPSREYARLEKDGRFQAAKFVGSLTMQWYINHLFPPFDNERWRRGLSLALDREAFVKQFLKGEEPLGKGLLTPASWAWDDTIQGHKYDPGEARKLLEASGVPKDKWVIKGAPNGSTSLNDQDVFWEASLKEFGIRFDWLKPERGIFATRVFKGLGGDGTGAMFSSSWSMRIDPDANIAQFYTEKGGYNSGQAPVPETEQLVKKARETLDVKERKAIYSQIQKIVLDKVYSTITLSYFINASHVRKRVGNLKQFYGGEGKERWHELWLDKA